MCNGCFNFLVGIEYTVGRVPMAGTDFSTHKYTYDDVEGDFALDHFSLTEEDLEYKVRFYNTNLRLN